MSKFRFGTYRLMLHWERDYGCNRRTGWSICRNGSFVVQLEPWLVVALWKAFS